MERCEQILDIITRNSGRAYGSPIKIADPTEADAMTKLYSECKKGEELFSSIVDELAKEKKMISSVHRSVLDGTRRKIRSYYWGELQLEKYLDSPESISLFAEKDIQSGTVRFRVSLEIDGNRASQEELRKHNSLIEMQLEKGCIYGLSEGAAKKITYTEKTDDVKKSLETGMAKKVQLCVLIDKCDKYKEHDYLDKMSEAVDMLMKPYMQVAK